MPRVVSDVMTPDPVCVAPDTSLTGTARQMRDHDIGAVLVVDDGQLLGLVTDRDLVHGIADGHDAVGDVIRPSPAVLPQNAPSAQALALMHRQRIDRLPVCDEAGKPVGIVSVTEVADG